MLDTEASVVMWKTSRTLFSEYFEVHSVYAAAPICRAKLVPLKQEIGIKTIKNIDYSTLMSTHHFLFKAE